MTMPEKVPEAVIQSIADYALQYHKQGECPYHDGRWQEQYLYDDKHTRPCTCVVKMARFEDFLKQLRWSYDHYSFNFAGMYVGVELDGYMHT